LSVESPEEPLECLKCAIKHNQIGAILLEEAIARGYKGGGHLAELKRIQEELLKLHMQECPECYEHLKKMVEERKVELRKKITTLKKEIERVEQQANPQPIEIPYAPLIVTAIDALITVLKEMAIASVKKR